MQSTTRVVESASQSKDLPWGRAFRYYRFLLGPCVAYVVICFGMLAMYRPELLSDTFLDIFNFMTGSLIMFFAALAIYVVGYLVKHRPARPLTDLVKALRSEHLKDDNIPFIIIPWLTMAVVITFFVKMKILIPTINPFYLDLAAHDLDKWLHFGSHPWEWLAPITNIPDITYILHRNYYVWFPAIYITFYWQVCTVRNPKLRLQFILSFVGVWVIIGTGLATALSSVGPIYFDRIAGGNSTSYAGAMAYLEALNAKEPLLTIEVREQLWNSYLGIVENRYVRGISAMPSVHVAMAFLLLLLGWSKHWAIGTAYTVFGVMIAIASVSLLWHYAIDGYISILAVGLIWWGAGKLAERSVASDEEFSQQG